VTDEALAAACRDSRYDHLKILEINEAGHIHQCLSVFAKHELRSYPDLNINDTQLESDSFDVVIHSEVLEHVDNPVHALSECLRILKPGGAVVFTVPVMTGRMTRSREGLPASYHGCPPQTGDDGYRVRTEFGADMWTSVIQAGFRSVKIHTRKFPASMAMVAVKDRRD